ncbi:peptide-methionine (S)-S-oxide reductase MsrA [Methanothermobacter marburgensis]|uniref:peptide-methionine (S)-S-oxide reductase MsrA n=1 Tax=Methanothermobacter marburgensis TaxID=145263 RepID=UPI0035B806BE
MGKYEKATFGAGCFWGVEDAFRRVRGVVSTRVGYMGGHVENPTYEDVCTGLTGHAEVVEVTFDPEIVGYSDLLDVFWSIHDPTSLNRQGPDVGEQYRSVIFYHDDEQRRLALESRKKLEESGRFSRRIVTAIEPAGTFYEAEDYHQQYLEKNRQGRCYLRRLL